MELIEGKLYLKKDLQKYLSDMGIPCSTPTLIKYEAEGIIISPRTSTKWRVYTADEIREIGLILTKRMRPNG
jgi:DNA-binding transcriptional MerR regulator